MNFKLHENSKITKFQETFQYCCKCVCVESTEWDALETPCTQLEETPETPASWRAEGLLFLHGLESNPGSSLQTEEEAGLP